MMDSSNPYGYSHNGHNQPTIQAGHQPYPAYYHPPPPGDNNIYPPTGGDNSYYITQPPPAQPYAYHQPPPVPSYGPPADQPPPSAPDGAKSLTGKLAGLLSRRSSTSSSSACSDCSSGDDDKKKKQKKKKNKKPRPAYATPPASHPRDGPHPFSIFTPKDDPANIVLTLSTAGGSATAHLTGPRSSKPAFEITWSADASGRHNITRHSLPSLSASHPTWAGLGRADREGKLWFQFPWGDWGDVDYLADHWASDVGFRAVRTGKDVWLQWSMVKHSDAATNGRFTARCFDTEARGMPEVIRVEVEVEGLWRLVVPVELVRTEEQLDEIVTVACTVVRRMAEVVRDAE